MLGCDALVAEVAELRAFVQSPTVDPLHVTPFQGWRVRDSIGHLVTIDRLALLALSDVDAFRIARAAFAEGTRAPTPDLPASDVFRRIAAFEDGLHGQVGWASLLTHWQAGLDVFCAAASLLPDDEKIEWFGASMRVGTLVAARQMEVWAYGQDIFDRYRTRRREGDRLRTVVEFALRTFAFSFANRDLPVPPRKPFVRLRSPTGEQWDFNEPDAEDRITGDAIDFCWVATQRRHVDETGLIIEGADARCWMEIAQCITGAPLDPPRPGERGLGRVLSVD